MLTIMRANVVFRVSTAYGGHDYLLPTDTVIITIEN